MSEDRIVNSTKPGVAFDAPRKRVICNLCGHKETEPYCPQNGRGLVQCKNCGLVYVGMRPDPDELYALYGETYFKNEDSGEVGYSDYVEDEANIRTTSQRRLKHIQQYIQPGKMLDVGCAMGFFIDEAAKNGWQVEGLDVSAYAAEYTHERFGHKTYHGSLDELGLEAEAYDLITMFDVIEHVPDPTKYVAETAKLLRSGGIFELATPDIGSLPARLTGKRWIGYKLSEEHVYYFSVKTLTHMLNEAGFDVIHVRHIGKYVTMRLFVDRLGFYLPWLSSVLALVEKTLNLSKRSAYINPMDIVAITARKR